MNGWLILCRTLLGEKLEHCWQHWGGGLGWLLVIAGQSGWLGSLPLDFYSPEAFGFLSLYGLPHLALARAALLFGLLAYLKLGAVSAREVITTRITLGAWWLVAALAQPLTALVMGFVIGMHLAVTGAVALRQHWHGAMMHSGVLQRWQALVISTCLAGLIPLPFILYNTWRFSTDPYLSAWTAQNIILSPHPLHFLLAYLLLMPFIIIGMRWGLRRGDWSIWLPVIWAASLPLLAYLPVNLQRRLPEGGWMALVVLALWGSTKGQVDRTRDALEVGVPIVRRSFWAVSFLSFPSTFMLIAGGILASVNPGQPVYRPASEIAAFDYLYQNVDADSVVLSAFPTGNALPAWAPVRVVIGLGPESAGLAELEPRVKAFYSGTTSDIVRQELLADLAVEFVFWGPAERALGDWDPGTASYLDKVFQAGDYLIFAR